MKFQNFFLMLLIVFIIAGFSELIPKKFFELMPPKNKKMELKKQFLVAFVCSLIIVPWNYLISNVPEIKENRKEIKQAVKTFLKI